MADWILIVVAAIGGVIATDVTSPALHRGLTRAQCVGLLAALDPLTRVSAACVGPDGQVVTHDR